MPYVDTTPALFYPKIREDNIQDALGILLENHGWTVALKFKKAVTSAHFLSNGHPITARHDESFAVAEHYIYRNASGKYLGLAIAAEFTEFTDHENIMPYYNWMSGTEQERQELIEFLEDYFERNKVNTSLYFYMVERLPQIDNGVTLLTPYGGSNIDDGDPEQEYKPSELEKMLQMALDVEVVEMDYSSGSKSSLYIKKAVPMTMQSPIVKCSLRPQFTESIDYPFMHTNWWTDSEIAVRGYIDSNSIFVVMQADNVPAWENNLVPTVPLYFGNIVPLDEGDEAVALFAGTVPPGSNQEQVAEFDFNSIVRGGERIMPILKSYPRHPSNGIDTVMLSRSKFGARYQEYFLSWNVAPNEMPPERVGTDGKRQYPRSYNNPNTDIYKFQFSPSRYSNKVHTSRIYLVHPEEGVRGYLDNAIGLNSTNFSAGRLRVRKDNCPDKVYDVYRYLPISGLSPLTKRPGTPYRPMGLGLLESEIDPKKENVKPDPSDTTPPAEVTNLVARSVDSGTILVTWEPPTDIDFHSVNIYLDDEEKPYARGVVGVTKYLIGGLERGSSHTVTIKTVDINGNESSGATSDPVTIV